LFPIVAFKKKAAAYLEPVVVVRNCCPIQEGGRFEALVVVPIVQKRPNNLPSKRRPLRARSCCSQLLPSKRRRSLRARSCCSQLLPNSRRRPLCIFCLQKGGRFAAVVISICPLKRRPLRARSCCSQLLPSKRRRPLT
jgi:hypothetical protein